MKKERKEKEREERKKKEKKKEEARKKRLVLTQKWVGPPGMEC